MFPSLFSLIHVGLSCPTIADIRYSPHIMYGTFTSTSRTFDISRVIYLLPSTVMCTSALHLFLVHTSFLVYPVGSCRNATRLAHFQCSWNQIRSLSSKVLSVSSYMHGATMSKRIPLQLQTTLVLRLIILHLNSANLIRWIGDHLVIQPRCIIALSPFGTYLL
jgi:hypothetical protein